MTLQVAHVSFGYDSGYSAPDEATRAFSLCDVSVAVQPGSLTGLLGPNGCGKTTLLKLMAGVLRPHLDSVLPLDAAPAALARLANRDVIGKLVLAIAP